MWGAFFNLDGINDVPCNLTIDEKTQGDDVLIFPNPATNKVNIVSNSEIESFEIIDLFGRVCYSESNPKMHYAFSLDGFSSGEYIIIGYTNLGTFHHKLIVR